MDDTYKWRFGAARVVSRLAAVRSIAKKGADGEICLGGVFL